MRQAFHIFKKDVRHLWVEIGVVFVLTGGFVWLVLKRADTFWLQALLVLTWSLLIARAIHDEAIPGDRQFWLTRPYNRGSLFAAKALLVAAFVSLPVATAQVIILGADGFPIVRNLPALIWCQFLWIAAFALPVAALSSVTSELVPLILAALVLVGSAFVLPSLGSFSNAVNLGALEWIRDSVGVCVLLAITSPVLYLQYKNRATGTSRAGALVGIAIGLGAYLLIPPALVFGLQSNLSKYPGAGSSIRIAFDPGGKSGLAAPHDPRVLVEIPLKISGLGEHQRLWPDAARVALETPEGKVEMPRRSTLIAPSASGDLRATFFVDRKLFERYKNRPLRLHLWLYLTLFGDQRMTPIRVGDKAADAVNGLRCAARQNNNERDIFCMAPYRWPGALISAAAENGAQDSFGMFISYLPFPASLDMNPISSRFVSLYVPQSASSIDGTSTIISVQPLAHFEREFDIEGVRLLDFALGTR